MNCATSYERENDHYQETLLYDKNLPVMTILHSECVCVGWSLQTRIMCVVLIFIFFPIQIL